MACLMILCFQKLYARGASWYFKLSYPEWLFESPPCLSHSNVNQTSRRHYYLLMRSESGLNNKATA
jgi:hypothetical protein